MRLLPLLLLLLLLLTAACTGPATDRALHRAETLIATHPDSAAALLDSIAPHIGHSDTRRATHTALTAHARHRADLPQLPITQLQWASQHYLLHPTPPTTPQALAHYQLGLAYQADTLHARALTAYNHAAQTATQLHDHHLLGLIYRGISDIYISNFLCTEALHYATLALDEFTIGGKRPYILYAMLDKAICHNNNLDFRQCSEMIDTVINAAICDRDTNLLTQSLDVAAAAAIGSADYPTAINYFTRLIEITDTVDIDQLRNLSLAYLRTNQPQLALHYLERYAPHDSISRPYVFYDYHLHMGNYREAIEAFKYDIEDQNRMYETVQHSQLATALRDYHNQAIELHTIKLSRQRNTWIAISIIAILCILLISYTYHYRSLRKDKKISDSIIAARELTQRLNETKLTLDRTSTQLADTSSMLSSASNLLQTKSIKLDIASQTLQTIFSQHLSNLNSFCDTLYSQPEDQTTKLSPLKQIIEKSRTPEQIAQLENALNTIHNNIMADFRADHPNLHDKDYQLFTYLILQLSSRAISILLNETIEKVYKQKNRLKNTIQKTDTPRTNRYLSFFR